MMKRASKNAALKMIEEVYTMTKLSEQEQADAFFEAVCQTIDLGLKSWINKTGCSSLRELRNSNPEEFEAHFDMPHIYFAAFVDCDCFNEASFDEEIRSLAVYN